MHIFASIRGGMVLLLFILAAILVVPMSCTLAQSPDKPSQILRTTPAPGHCTMFCPTPENGE
jgi:hypothetical protein